MEPEVKIISVGAALTIAAISGIALLTFNGCNPGYSTGVRTGVVQKISDKGLIFKSTECEMLMGGARIATEGQATANLWEFSVTSDSVKSDLSRAASEGLPVRISYHQYLAAPMWLSSDYVADKVEPLTK
jgi:hypothetical protein